jgi:hypothetical protein
MNTGTTTPPKGDSQEIIRALDVLFERDDVVELRAFKSRGTISGYYDDHDVLAKDAARINQRAGTVYVTLNRINPDLLARRANRFEEYAKTTTSDDHVIRRRWLPIDLDPARPADISSSDAEHEAAIERARQIRTFLVNSLGWPEPIATDSGNGAHLLARIDLPNDSESADLVQWCLEALDFRFSDSAVKVDTATFNASRIFKLYGTVATKGDHTEARPHRIARLLNVPGSIEIVPVEKLRELAAMGLPDPPRPDRNGRAPGSNGQIDVAEYLARHNVEVLHHEPYRCSRGSGHRWVLQRCVWNPEHTDKSAWVIQWDNGAIAAGCQHNSCQGKRWHDFRDAVEPGGRERRHQRDDRCVPDPNEVAFGPDISRDDDASEPRRPVIEFRAVRADELARADYSVTWLIEGHLAADQPAFIGGPSKTCKTLIAIDAALSLVTTADFLGAFKIPEGQTVAYLSGEGGLCILQDYALRIAASKGWKLEDMAGSIVFCDRLPRLDNVAHVAALEEFLLDHAINVVFLDPTYLMLSGRDAGNLFVQGETLRYVNEVCLQAGCTPILLHHLKKNVADPFAPPELSDLAWAGFDSFAGQWWLLGRRAKYSGDRPGEHELWMNVGGRIGHTALHALDVHEGSISAPGGRYWAVEIARAKDAREAAEERASEAKQERARRAVEKDAEKVVQAAAKFPAGETENILRGYAGLSGNRMKTAVAYLLDNGDLVPCEVKKPNRKVPYSGFKLAGE